MKKESPKEITGAARILLVAVSLIIFLPILLLAALFYMLWGVILCASVWLMWGKQSLSIFVFRHFGGSRNFNPIGIVIRPFQPAKTYRFYQTFKKFKHGNPTEVEEIKNSLFRDLKIEH